SIGKIDGPAQRAAAFDPALLVDQQVRRLERDDLEPALDAVLRADRAGAGVAHVALGWIAAAFGHVPRELLAGAVPVDHAIAGVHGDQAHGADAIDELRERARLGLIFGGRAG